MSLTGRAREFLTQTVWDIDLGSLRRFKAFGVRLLRLGHVILRDAAEGQLTLWAMSLAYTTFLSLAPLLALSFSVLKAFGVHNQIRPPLENFLAPLGSKGPELADKIIGFVENIQVGVLGSIGLAVLIYTVLSAFQKIEAVFNYIWRVQQPRGWVQKFSEYLSIALIGPVLIFSALGISASVTRAGFFQKIVSIEPVGTAFYWAGQVVPYVLVCAAFTLAYLLIPNTRVKFSSALVGGFVAGAAWEASGWIFSSFMATSTQYTAIYSGFAVILLFMVWVYLSWLILLVGGQIAYYHQHAAVLSRGGGPESAEDAGGNRLALSLMFLIGRHFYHRQKPWTFEDLVIHFGLSAKGVRKVLEALERRGFILETRDEPPAYVPARDIGTIRLNELLHAVRSRGVKDRPGGDFFDPNVERVLSRIDQAVSKSLGAETVRDMVLSDSEPSAGRAEGPKKRADRRTAGRPKAVR